MRCETKKRNADPVVVIALPFAYQDGVDKYNGIMRYLREKDVGWELRIVRDTLTVERFRTCLSEPVAGVICGVIGGVVWGNDVCRRNAWIYESIIGACRQRKVPLVGLDWPQELFGRKRMRQCSFFNIDSEAIGRVAARTLLESGNYAAYGFVNMCPTCAWARVRGAAFAQEVRNVGHRVVRTFDGDLLADAAGLATWLEALPKPAAVFAANDLVADIVLKTCGRLDLRMPGDVSVVGVDDDPVACVHTRPTLTSVHPNFEEMGYLAARELAELIAGRSRGARSVVAGNPTVTSRMSTAPFSSAGMLVRRADEIIEERACQDIDSNAIADALKISRRLLDLRYRRIKGMSVREAIIGARLRRARHLLIYSAHSIGAISRMCGYRTASYLGKVFMRHEGLSMGEYRAKHCPANVDAGKESGVACRVPPCPSRGCGDQVSRRKGRSA